MRKIDKIIIHCSATPAGRDVTIDEIRSWHIARGFNDIGYHYVIDLQGRTLPGRSEAIAGAHCLNQNSHSIGVCYVGGLDAYGRPADTRTPSQKEALIRLVAALRMRYPEASVHGHREYAAKACPCFDAAAEYASVGIESA